jgi:formamidopyrimidine-DNA glycosylase
MPELPDVEGFRQVLLRNAKGRRIEHVAVPDPAMLRNATPPTRSARRCAASAFASRCATASG